MERSELYKLLNDLLYWCFHSERILQSNFPFPFPFLSHKRRCCLKNVCNAEKLFDKSSRVRMLTPGTIRGQLAGTETLWWMGRAIRSDQNMSRRDSRRILFRAKWPFSARRMYHHLTSLGASPLVWPPSSSVLYLPLGWARSVKEAGFRLHGQSIVWNS